MIKLTNKDKEDLVKFNKHRKSHGELALTENEYLDYLYGKGLPSNYKRKTNTKLKLSLEIPQDRNPYSLPSCTTNSSFNGVSVTEQMEKIEISKQYSVAPICNKGAYQVVTSQDFKTIGRKI